MSEGLRAYSDTARCIGAAPTLTVARALQLLAACGSFLAFLACPLPPRSARAAPWTAGRARRCRAALRNPPM
eukprot:525310-Pyramimonas_sp.AAC.1